MPGLPIVYWNPLPGSFAKPFRLPSPGYGCGIDLVYDSTELPLLLLLFSSSFDDSVSTQSRSCNKAEMVGLSVFKVNLLSFRCCVGKCWHSARLLAA